MFGINSNGITGKGEMISRSFQVDDFTGLDIGGAYLISYRNSLGISVTVEMQENLFEYLQVEVKNRKLHVSSSKSFNISGNNNRPRIYIEAPHLDAINLSGAAGTDEWDKITVESFFIDASGAANIAISLEVEQLDIKASGAAKLELDGNAGKANMSASGACKIKAGNLHTRESKINVSGASNADIACSDNLEVSASGASNVRYTGNPAVTRRVSGASSVKGI
jgi:hypothetical protein